MNPRRPSPAEPQSAVGGTPTPPRLKYLDKLKEVVRTDENNREYNLEQFFEWCVKKRGNSEDTCKDYVSYLKRPLDKSKKWSVIAYKLYYEFLGKEDKAKELKVEKKVNIPVYRVPSVEEINAVLNHEDERIRILYRLLLESGVRLKEALFILNNYDSSLDQREDEFLCLYCELSQKEQKIILRISCYTVKEDLYHRKYSRSCKLTRKTEIYPKVCCHKNVRTRYSL